MLLALDIGNTNIKTGLFEDGKLKVSFRLAIDRNRTADEYGIQMESFFSHVKLSTSQINGIIFSSVQPTLNYTIDHMCSLYFPKVKPIVVHAGMNTGIKFDYNPIGSLGTDRICNAVAAHALYGGNLITIDFGTATTFGVMRDGLFLGGMICPGFKVSANALTANAALLPNVELLNPGSVVGQSTEHCIQSGLLYGYVGLVEYLTKKAKDELQADAKVVATGGMGDLIAEQTSCIDIINPTMTLTGLSMLYEKNRPIPA